MLKRILAARLTCVLTVSLSAPALAIRTGSAGPQAAGKLESSQYVPSSYPTLSFEQIRDRVLAGNLSLRAAREGLESARSMDLDAQFDDAIDDLDDAIEDLEDAISQMEGAIASMSSAAAAGTPDAAIAGLQAALTATEEGGIDAAALAQSISAISAASVLSTYSQLQAESMKTNLGSLEEQKETLEEQLDDLKEEKDDQKKEYEKTLQDTIRQIEYAENQTVSGAQSLYLSILSTQTQLEALKDSQAGTERTVTEMELRYDLGQISRHTLIQVQNGFATLVNTVSGLETSLSVMRSSLQSLMGETPDGNLTLLDTPSVTPEELDALRYDADLVQAKKNSYSLYSAARAVEKAEDDMEDARKDEGKNSYQYKMAEHSYQSAVYQNSAAISGFELAFPNLYRAIAPARATLAVKEGDLAYQEQVFAAAELKFSQGNLSANALANAQSTLDGARRDVESARLDLFTAYHAYRQAVQYGLTGNAG